MKVETPEHPFTIDCFRDGGSYELVSAPPLVQTNLFLKVGFVDQLYVKVPSERGLQDYRQFVKPGIEGPEGVRPLEGPERFDRLRETLSGLPELAPLTSIGSELAHYVAIHKLQHDRLLKQQAVKIPRAKFGALRSKGRGFFRTFEAAFFQEKIDGTTLWNMFDFEALTVRARWRPALPAIASQLSELLNSGFAQHIDWNIQNFVFNEEASRLFYVDLKPTTFLAKQSNEHNLKGLREYFLV